MAAAAGQHNYARALPAPRGFDGTRPELWKEFADKLTAYAGLQDHDFSNYMDAAARAAQPITDERHTRERQGEVVPGERAARRSRQLRYVLSTLCNGPPLTSITSTETLSGFELWRLLCRRDSPDPVASHYGNTWANS